VQQSNRNVFKGSCADCVPEIEKTEFCPIGVDIAVGFSAQVAPINKLQPNRRTIQDRRRVIGSFGMN